MTICFLKKDIFYRLHRRHGDMCFYRWQGNVPYVCRTYEFRGTQQSKPHLKFWITKYFFHDFKNPINASF